MEYKTQDLEYLCQKKNFHKLIFKFKTLKLTLSFIYFLK